MYRLQVIKKLLSTRPSDCNDKYVKIITNTTQPYTLLVENKLTALL